MKKSIRGILLLVGTLMICSLSAAAQAQANRGTCGTCNWEVNSEGVLVISPKEGNEGRLYWADSAPWLDPELCDTTLIKRIKRVRFEGTINIEYAIDEDHVANPGMFQDCKNLEVVDFTGARTDKLTDMALMFEDCTNLKYLVLDNFDMSKVGDDHYYSMFWGCTSIASIYCRNTTPPALKDSVFKDIPTKTTCLLQVPEANIKAYKAADGWKEIDNIVSILQLRDNVTYLLAGTYNQGQVVYKRNVSSGVATFCLPFDINVVDTKAHNECIQKVYTVYQAAFLDTESNKLRLLIQEQNGIIPAGTPFVAKCTSAGQVTLTNSTAVTYTSYESEPKPISLTVFEDNGSSVLLSNHNYEVSIGGRYTKWSDAGDEGGILAFATSGNFGPAKSVNPFRMYVRKKEKKEIDNGSSGSKTFDIELLFDDDEDNLTAINQIRACMESGKAPHQTEAYNMMGQKVAPNAKGVVIINGKKYMNK